MTLTAPRTVLDATVIRQRLQRFSVHHAAFAVLLVVTACLYLWNLSVSGWANGFYSAAAQAGSQSWTA